MKNRNTKSISKSSVLSYNVKMIKALQCQTPTRSRKFLISLEWTLICSPPVFPTLVKEKKKKNSSVSRLVALNLPSAADFAASSGIMTSSRRYSMSPPKILTERYGGEGEDRKYRRVDARHVCVLRRSVHTFYTRVSAHAYTYTNSLLPIHFHTYIYPYFHNYTRACKIHASELT